MDKRGDTQAAQCSRPAMTFRTLLPVCSCMSFEETTIRLCDLGKLAACAAYGTTTANLLVMTPPSSFCAVIVTTVIPSGKGPTKCLIRDPAKITAAFSPLTITVVPGSVSAWISTMCPYGVIDSTLSTGVRGPKLLNGLW